jgi:pimeloyl-ACP methyl ester carboxylesterase
MWTDTRQERLERRVAALGGVRYHRPGPSTMSAGLRAELATVPLRRPVIHRSGFPVVGLRPVHRRRRDVCVMTRDGVRLSVRDCGARCAERTVVFLHGFCLSGDSWARQIDYLLRRYGDRIRVISYDHRGHGRSGGAPMGSYRIEQLAADLADVLVALDVGGPLTLVGHSMGGMTALAYLGRPAADRPVDPAGLVLVATAAGRIAERGLGRLLATPGTAGLIGLINRTPDHALRVLSRPVWAMLGRWYGYGGAQRATLMAVTAAALATTPVSAAVGFLPALNSYDQYRTLGEIRAHTIVVSGGADVLTPPAHSRDLGAGIPDALHVHLPHAGHMLPQQAPHVINHAIRCSFNRGRAFRGCHERFQPNLLLDNTRHSPVAGRPGSISGRWSR